MRNGFNDPFISGPYLSPIALTGAKRTGNKQYDNELPNGAAAALAGSFAAEVFADNEPARQRALSIARMGGSFLPPLPWGRRCTMVLQGGLLVYATHGPCPAGIIPRDR